MSALKIIAYITAAILIFFGILFIWGSFSPEGSIGWIPIGVITILIGFALIYFASQLKSKTNAVDTQVTYKVDLPSNVAMDSLKCKSCGGSLTMDNIKMVAGAPVVSCPYCHSTYQLTEEPKW